jgi:hypothetical protein
LTSQAFDIEADDAALRSNSMEDQHALAAHFTRLRAEYPVRREFNSYTAHLTHATSGLIEKARTLGFKIEAD